ncbi:MAG: ATP-dependent DNA helicase [Myxococcota bacterium]|nr:ATP-dependent DNA helicase [Myxococcota bacterium]
MSRLEELFGPNGPLARALGRYERREGQIAMAEAVARALSEDRTLLCEAGTGTGKTLAYLVPALLSGRKVVVSTATRALQEQIYFKDLPVVAQALGRQPRVALMKGVGNYLCRRRYADFTKSGESLRPQYAGRLSWLQSFVEESESGDLAELVSLADDDPLRPEVSSSSDTRVGAQCPYYDECFVTRMKREAEAAELVIVNHHLFFADLSLRGAHPARVLPDYEAVVFDEAHQIEDVATEFFSVRASSVRVARLLGDVERTLRGGEGPLFSPASTLTMVTLAVKSSERFFASLSRLSDVDGRVALEPDAFAGDVEQALFGLDNALEGVTALLASLRGRLADSRERSDRARAEGLGVLERRTEQLRENLTTIASGGSGRVVWLERNQGRLILSSSPVDLSFILQERVFERLSAVVLTSATLATGEHRELGTPSFDYVRTRLGLTDSRKPVEELSVRSPFDFARQALLYTPRDLPAPGTNLFWDRACERIAELIQITGGGSFVLTTSLRAMRELHRRLGPLLPDKRLMVQGQAPKAALVRQFREEQNAVLTATMGFWEGVDVPGRALRLVVLEKIPFAVPTDPIILARSRSLEEAGKNPFVELSVPQAALSLKQGFGRLIRSESDVGIVALLDERLHRKGYGRRLLSALPPASRTSELEDVRRFWAERGESNAPVEAEA